MVINFWAFDILNHKELKTLKNMSECTIRRLYYYTHNNPSYHREKRVNLFEMPNIGKYCMVLMFLMRTPNIILLQGKMCSNPLKQQIQLYLCRIIANFVEKYSKWMKSCRSIIWGNTKTLNYFDIIFTELSYPTDLPKVAMKTTKWTKK